MLYFAYGSNMAPDQIQERCPSSRFVDVAVLRDHKLAFTRRSTQWGCGAADVVAEHGETVWGVVYKIAKADISMLDSREGYSPGSNKNAYDRRECMVFLDGRDQRPQRVEAYFGRPQTNPPLPSAEYMSQILKGARHWRLPKEYIKKLEQIEVSG